LFVTNTAHIHTIIPACSLQLWGAVLPATELYTEAQRTHELASSAAAVGKRARSGPAAAAVHVMPTTEQSTPQLLPPLAVRGGEVVVGAASAATPVADNGQDR
jgi:hypothetical protein